jgi:mannose-1-phosphate guanylyltransferase/mannose-1-phosphate guanylyltransferase/mannose-6-phosphate isomerase
MSSQQTGTRVIVPVILSGGSGTRLWPLSRQAFPKQFLALAGAKTMLQETAARVDNPNRFAAPLIVASRQHGEEIKSQLSSQMTGPAKIFLEPLPRNTAPAIALAALSVEDDDLLLVMPSDHVISDTPAFLEAVEAGVELAQSDWLVTLGVRPTRPETGFGYIRKGRGLSDRAFAVDRFVEKPGLETASLLFQDGDHFWNAGIFLFRAKAFIAALRAHAPDVLHAVEASLGGSADPELVQPDESEFARSPSISVDYAVMEKADRVAVIPADFGWSDVGSWEALYDLVPLDEDGNSIFGEVVALDTRGSLIRSSGPLVAAVDVEDLVIVASSDVVLVARRPSSQRIKELVDILNARSDARI